MTQRPYLMLGIQELEGLAQSSSSDTRVVDDLIQELGHRRNSRAQRLKLRLERLKQQAVPEAGLTSGLEGKRWEGGVETVLTPISSAQGVGPEPTMADEYTSLKYQYESLRATFTAEAELLARWGMTPRLPPELQELVFDEWSKTLRNDSHGAEALAADRIRIAQERAFLEHSLKANGIRDSFLGIQTTLNGVTRD